MLFTHVVMGGLVGVLAASAYGSAPSLLFAAGALGGLLPDLDMVYEHRRTFHYPFIGLAITAIAGLVAVVTGVLLAWIAFAVLAGATLHSLMDLFGAGKELRPWERTDDRAVYDHLNGRWLDARRLLYDGSLRDLVLYLGAVAICLRLLGGRLVAPLTGLSVMAVIYTAGRHALTRYIDPEITRFSDAVRIARHEGVRAVLR